MIKRKDIENIMRISDFATLCLNRGSSLDELEDSIALKSKKFISKLKRRSFSFAERRHIETMLRLDMKESEFYLGKESLWK